MVKWLVTVFLALVILSAATPLLRRFRVGRLPGDFQIPMRGRVYYIPFEVGDGRERELFQRLLAVGEGDRVSGRAVALVEQPPHIAHLAHEDVLARVRR